VNATTDHPDLLAALASLAAAEALTVGADGFNPHFQYAYMTEDALFKAARAALAEVGLSGTISFEAGQHETVLMQTERKGEQNQTLATVTAVLTLRDQKGQQVECKAFGQGLDPADKAYAKAMTMAAKYVVQKALMIAVEHGDDTDAGGDAGSRAGRAGARRANGDVAASDRQLGFLCSLVKKGHYIESKDAPDVEHMALRLARMQANDAALAAFVKIPKGVASDLIEKLQVIPEHRVGEVLDKLTEWEADNGAPEFGGPATAAGPPLRSPAETGMTEDNDPPPSNVPTVPAPADDDDVPF
jgi:ERF superfamily